MLPFRTMCAAASVLLITLAGCTSDNASSPTGTGPAGTAGAAGGTVPGGTAPTTVFAQGCPQANQSVARTLDAASGLQGTRAVGGEGDYLLANDKAAFVISAPVSEQAPQRTWYHYGGIVVDAAAIEGCKQVAPDEVDEIGLVVGTLNINDFTASILRTFRGEKVEVLNDGADGQAARVRVTGTDDYLQLIEYQLIRAAAEADKPKPLSKPFGLRIEVDYTLDPGDAALQITMRIIAETAGPRAFLGAALVTWGDAVEPIHRPESKVDVASFGLDLGVPWQVAQGDTGSYAFAATKATQAIAAISGVNAFIDVNQALEAPLVVDEVGDTKEMTFLLAVSPTDANRATQALLEQDADLGPGVATLRPIAGTTVDPAGQPVGDVQIDVQMRRDGGEWGTYDVAASDAAGRFELSAAVLQDAKGADPDVRLRFVAKGRAPVVVDVPTGTAGSVAPAVPDTVALGPAGAIDVAVTHDGGQDLPARLTLSQDGKVVQTIDAAKRGAQPVPPGTYDVVVSHGYEFDRVETTVEVPEDGRAAVTAELKRTVDTDGWIAVDTHVHAAPSTDSSVLPERRYLDAAVTGVEVVVNTNHEVIEDLGPELQASGLAAWVAAITGQEVTASSPEHTTMFPVTPDGSIRGGNPLWYGLGLNEIYAAEQKRGASIRGLNHPTGYLDLIKWDPVTSTPGLTDASILGLGPDAETWSWDFEQVELQNGTQAVLGSEADDDGIFDFWQGAYNHGKRITAVAASDAHGINLGDVMTYVRVPDDDPARITPEQVVEAIKNGRAVLSTGAFAEVEIGTAGPGDLAKVGGRSADVSLRVQAARGIDVSTVQVFANCDLVATVPIPAGDGAVRFDDIVKVDLPADANITLLGFGAAPLTTPFHDADPVRVPRFTTNPIFVDVDGNGTFDPPGDKTCSYPRT